MDAIPISEAREHLADIANRIALRGERVLIERRGKNLFALVSVEDLELLEHLEDKMDLDVVRERLDEPSESWVKVKKALGL